MHPDALEHQQILGEREPIQLISVSKDAKGKDVFDLNQDALAILQGIDTPIGIVSMCGVLRCGKSFLLNAILG
jgi:hypothetical protein